MHRWRAPKIMAAPCLNQVLVYRFPQFCIRFYVILCLTWSLINARDYELYNGFQRHIKVDENQDSLNIYCYNGEPVVFHLCLRRLWVKPVVEIDIVNEQHIAGQFIGDNASVVHELYENFESSWINPTPLRSRSVTLHPFKKSCLGMVADRGYTIYFNVIAVDVVRLFCLIFGILLFLLAGPLSRNVIFYYSSGITLGVLASLLIIIFIISRFIPKKIGAYSVLIGGSSIVLYFFQFLWMNIHSVLQAYRNYVLGYVVISALISFAVCYKRGPVTDTRTQDLLKWSMQLVALICVYEGTQIDEASISIILLMTTCNLVPMSPCTKHIRKFWRRRFPPKCKLLTEEEYIRQGEEITKKELDALREYCRSPDCNTWKTVSQLKTPNKFASFVEGSPHVSDSEEDEWINGPLHEEGLLTDDEEQ